MLLHVWITVSSVILCMALYHDSVSSVIEYLPTVIFIDQIYNCTRQPVVLLFFQCTAPRQLAAQIRTESKASSTDEYQE